MRTSWIIASTTAFVAMTISSNLSAQNVATKVTTTQLISAGTTALSSPSPGIIPTDDLRIKASKKSETGERVLFSQASRFPQVTPNDLSTPSSLFGFPGLTHRDQRLAGKGAFVNTQFSTEPPDQGLAAGNGFILEAVNTALAVYDQHTGSLLVGPTPLNQFYNLTPEIIRPSGPYGDFLSDPRCYFDRQLRRWFITILQIDIDPTTGNFGNRSHLLIAVSQTADPTQGFNLFTLDVTDDGLNGTQDHTAEGCPCYGDQPLIGADANGFYLSTNEFSITGGPLIINRAQIYAMSKKKLVHGTASTIVHLSGLSVPGGGRAFSIQPAISPDLEESDDDDNGVEYFVSSFNTRLATNNQLTVWALSNTRSLNRSNPDVIITNVVISSEIYSVPPDAVQKTGPIPLGDLVNEPEELLATNEHRMQQVTFADGKLFSAVTTGIQQGANLVAGIAYFVVAPSFRNGLVAAQVRTQGYISLLNNNVFYPSVGVTADGNGVIAFSISGPDFFPSAAFASFDGERGAGSVRLSAAGVAPDDGFSGYKAFGGAGSGRWGDYSAAVADGETVWFANEYIPGPRTTLANWGTFIASKPVD